MTSYNFLCIPIIEYRHFVTSRWQIASNRGWSSCSPFASGYLKSHDGTGHFHTKWHRNSMNILHARMPSSLWTVAQLTCKWKQHNSYNLLQMYMHWEFPLIELEWGIQFRKPGSSSDVDCNVLAQDGVEFGGFFITFHVLRQNETSESKL